LYHLLEILSGDSISPNVRRVNKKIQKVENIKVSLKYLQEKQGVHLGLSAEGLSHASIFLSLRYFSLVDIYAGEEKTNLALLYTLIRHFHLRPATSEMEPEGQEENVARTTLLTWLNQQLTPLVCSICRL
jgi:hypothetical protein